MGIPDNPLDQRIAQALRNQVIITDRRQAQARARLLQQAAQQVILAPYTLPCAPRSPLEQCLNHLRLALSLLWLDDHRYQHAAAHRAQFLPGSLLYYGYRLNAIHHLTL
jgi:hypothetical protein